MKYLVTLAICLISACAFAQGNILKGYEPIVNISPKDTTLEVVDVFWPYRNQNYLFIEYNWQNPKIALVNTETWELTKWINAERGFDRIDGITNDGKSVVLAKVTLFLVFRREKYKIINLESDEELILSRKELRKFISENGKLNSGKTLLYSKYILSPDRNYFITRPILKSSLMQNFDNYEQKRFELIIFKYTK